MHAPVQPKPAHWLDQHASGYHAWQQSIDDRGRIMLYRPLGLIERGFDLDGFYEGRADINAYLELEVATTATQAQVKRRILLAWTLLRIHHVLLMAKATGPLLFMKPVHKTNRRYFVLNPPTCAEQALVDASCSLTHLQCDATPMPMLDFFHHAQNVGRIVQPDKSMAELFVAPLEATANGRYRLKALFVMGHQISDGLTNYTWCREFLRLLNQPMARLEHRLQHLVDSSYGPRSKLPLPQEDLYQPIQGSRARQRWYWAILRCLRHVRRPTPRCFQNPLRRREPLKHAISPLPTYSSILDYSKTPPLNTFTVQAKIPPQSARKLVRLCKEAGTSIGAGSFVLVAMVMMQIYEEDNPDMPLRDRLSFIGSFPLNPRPFFNHHAEPDGLMLAFSDGVVLPFLSSNFDFSQRFRLLVRQAHRQLRQYQKKKNTASSDLKSPTRVISETYLGAFDRIARTLAALPEDLRATLYDGTASPQGCLSPRPNPSLATCGISSVGKSGWNTGLYDLTQMPGTGPDAFVADYRDSKQNVRIRDGEFLTGIWGEADGSIAANASVDGNAISPEAASRWKHMMENFLDQVPEVAHL